MLKNGGKNGYAKVIEQKTEVFHSFGEFST